MQLGMTPGADGRREEQRHRFARHADPDARATGAPKQGTE